MNPGRLLLDRLQSAGVPAIGISMRDPTDRTTWTIQYPANTPEADRQRGAAFLETYDVLAEAQAWVTAEAERHWTTQPLLDAIVIWLAQRLEVPLGVARAEILAIVRRRSPDP